MTRRLAVLALLGVLACGKQTFLAAAFVQTPALPNPEDPSSSIPQFQVMTAYLGTIDTTDPTKIDASKEAPITDATATVEFMSGGSDPRWLYDPSTPAAQNHWTQSSGTYTLSSKDEPLLTFEQGVPYTLVLQTKDGDAFGAKFIPGDPIDIAEFKDSTCNVTLPAPLTGSYQAPRCMDGTLSTPLTITRTDPPAANGQYLPAFVLVGQIDPQNPTAEPSITYKSVPDSADALLKFVLSDLPYRKKSYDIPATAFTAPGYYLVSLIVVKQGKVSGNAFLGSTALAGTGAAGIVRIQ